MWEAQSQEFHLSWKVARHTRTQSHRRRMTSTPSFSVLLKAVEIQWVAAKASVQDSPLSSWLWVLSLHTSPDIRWSMHKNYASKPCSLPKLVYGAYSKSSSQRVTEGGLWVSKWEEVDEEQRKQLWKSLGLMEILSTTSFLQPLFCLRLSTSQKKMEYTIQLVDESPSQSDEYIGQSNWTDFDGHRLRSFSFKRSF